MTDVQLETLFPLGKQLTIRDVNLTIKPFRFGELSRVLKAADPIFSSLFTALKQGNNQIEMITTIVAESNDSIVDLIQISTKQPREWIEQLDIDEGVELFMSVLEVNGDFFVRRVLPGLNDRMQKMTQTGLTP